MMVVKEVIAIIQPRLGAEICPEKVSLMVSSHQTRKRYRYKNQGKEKGGDR